MEDVADVPVAASGGALSFDGWMMTVRRGVTASEVSERLDSLIFGAGDLLDQIDDRTPEFCVWNQHEGLRQLESVRRGEIIGYVLCRRGIGLCMVMYQRAGCSFKEELYRHLQ